MSGIEVINSKEYNENVDLTTDQQKNGNLSNGPEVMQHDEGAYSNLYTNGKSFDDIEDKKLDECSAEEEGIHFGFDFKLHPDGVKKMTSVGTAIQSNVLVLQHKCVMYTYAYSLKVIKEDEEEGLLCEFNLFPISYTYGHPTKMTKGGVPSTIKQKAPILNDATLKIGNIPNKISLVSQLDGTYKSDVAITLESLQNLTKAGIVTLRVEMTIDEIYFDLGEYVELSPKVAPIASNSDRILNAILRGEKVPKSDWVITVGDGSPTDFHVHGPVLANASFILGEALRKHMSAPKVLVMVSHENRFILTQLKSEDMRVLLTFIYQHRFALPSFDSISRIGQFLGTLFKEQILEFFENWQAQMVNNVLNLDKSNEIETISECVRYLIAVHSAPQGALLAAYNAALIVGADTWQMMEAKKKYKKGKIEREVKKNIGYDWPVVDQALELINDFKEVVCGVEKCRFV